MKNKRKQLKDFSDLMAKLDSLNWISEENDSITSKDGFKLSWSHKLHSDGFQLVARVIKNNVFVMSWGFECHAHEQEFGRWLNSITLRLTNERYDAKSKAEEQARDAFYGMA
jgi:hypothetical protein